MVKFSPLANPSSYRKLAAAMWHAPNDPHILGFVDIDMTAALAFLKDYNERHACKVTLTHLTARALAVAIARHPNVNAKVGWSQIAVRDSIDIFCQVATDGGRDLSGYKIEAIDKLSLQTIAERLTRSAKDIREDRDPAFKRTRSMFQLLPLWCIRLILGTMDFLCNTLNLHMPKQGMPQDPFGSAMVTSVGMLGIDSGFAPFTPIARCPIILTVTRLKQRPWVVDDQVVPRPVLRLCGTFDHRVIDGYHAGELSGEIEELLYHPDKLLTDAERSEAPTAQP